MDPNSVSPQIILSSSPSPPSNNYYTNNNINARGTHGFGSSPRSSPPSIFLRSPPSPPQRSEPLNLQTRRLQLRNARFKGTSISPCKVSDKISTWRSLSPNSDVSVDKENHKASPNGNGVEQQQLKQPPGPVRRRVSILQEIHDSSQRGRRLRRPSVSRLFGPPLNDDNELNLSRPRPYRSPSAIRRSSPYSIVVDSYTDSMMAAFPQNRSSPLSSDVMQKNRLRSNSRNRTASYATERYIEHLETQLAAAQNQSSPLQASSTTRPQVSKLRSLSAEIKVLRQEITEWEDKFDVRVHEEVALRTDIESKLRNKIIFLEGQLEDYATRVKELECERDIQAQKLRNVESLRSTNRGLERRIDVLTELLAQCPTKTESRSPEVSPSRSPGPRLSRPKSMLPSIPLRSDIVYQSASDAALKVDPEGGAGKLVDSDLPDLTSDDSTVASSTANKSERSSTISHASSASSQWSVPLPFSPELQGKTPSRSRNMRRFPSGTCTLKPLILPTTTTPSPASPQRQILISEPYPSIYSPNYSRPNLNNTARVAQEETLAALEGRRDRYQIFGDAMSEPDDDMTESPLSNKFSPNVHGETYLSTHNFQSTLYSELAEAERESPCSLSHERQLSQTHSHVTTNPSTPIGSCRLKAYGSKRDSYSTPKAYNTATCSRSSRSLSQRKGSNSVELETGSDMFRNLKSFYSGTFARTLIARIWQKSMERIAKLSWWILGLLIGSQQRDDWLKSSSLRMKSGHRSTDASSLHTCKTCGQCSQDNTKQESPRHSIPDYSKSDRPATINHTVTMWTKFSLAVIVAFGRAIRYGPAAVLRDEDEPAVTSHTRQSSVRIRLGRTSLNNNSNDASEAADDVSHQYSTWPTRPLTAEHFFIN